MCSFDQLRQTKWLLVNISVGGGKKHTHKKPAEIKRIFARINRDIICCLNGAYDCTQ